MAVSRQAEIIDAYALIRDQVIDELEEAVSRWRRPGSSKNRGAGGSAVLPSTRPPRYGTRSGRPSRHAQQVLASGYRLRAAGRTVARPWTSRKFSH